MTNNAALPKIKVSSFKAFRDDTEIEIRPLTLLYGHNQSGKSTLLRLLPFLADSLYEKAPALDMRSPSLRNASFKELGWMGPEPSFSPRLTLSAPSAPNEPTYHISFTNENGAFPNRIELRHGTAGDKFMVSYAGKPKRSSTSVSALYAGKYRGSDWSGRLQFESLAPIGLPDKAQEILEQVLASLKSLERIQWIQANRLPDTAANVRNSRCCSTDGSNLVDLLKNKSSVLQNASDWMKAVGGLGAEIDIKPDGSGHDVFEIRPENGERLPLRLSGEGIRALLPILLTACWADSREEDAPSMLAIEEPEAHLHPNVQIALCDRLIKTCNQGTPVVLETHSIYLLRSIQRAVLDGRLKPRDIALYWIGRHNDGAAKARKIEVTPDATLLGWHPDEFEQEQRLAGEILDLRWKRNSPK